MCFFALFKNSPQICSQRLHDSTLMILRAAGISSLNITGVYILFSRFAALSVLTQTHVLLLLFCPYVFFNNYYRGQVPLTRVLTQPSEDGGRRCCVRKPDNQDDAPSAATQTFFRGNVQQISNVYKMYKKFSCAQNSC